MNLSQIRRVLDYINAEQHFGTCTAIMLTQVEASYAVYDDAELGELREVIDDRLILARRKQSAAGY